jgi:arginase
VRGTELIGVPIDSVGRSGGTELGPQTLRELGLVDALQATDAGDLEIRIRGEKRDPATGIIASDDVLRATTMLREAIAASISGRSRPFLAGGCCTELVGALAGARDQLGRIGLAYVDGHLDLYDGETSPTGEAADMPIAVAIGRGPERWVQTAGGASISPRDTAILGYRDKEESLEHGMLQPEELRPGLTHVPVEEVRVEGPAATGKRIAVALSRQAPFWLHLDVDVLDPDVFPATDYLMPNGMNWDELAAVLAPLASSPSLIGASVACYNPDKDPGRECGRRLVTAISSAFGG